MVREGNIWCFEGVGNEVVKQNTVLGALSSLFSYAVTYFRNTSLFGVDISL